MPDGEVEGRVPPGPGVGALVREEEVELGAGGHRVLAQGVLTSQVVAHNADNKIVNTLAVVT